MGVHVYVTDEGVDITFTGLDRWLTLNPGGQHLTIADIASARVASRAELLADLGWRVGGGYWPGALATGWFTVKGRKGLRQLWCAYRDRELLAIDTRLHKPCRVVLQDRERHDHAWFIGERLGRR